MDAETREYRETLRRDPCSYCGAVGQMDIDHIVAKASGGSDHWSNLTATCKVCNSSKHQDDLLSFMSRLDWVAPLDHSVEGAAKGRQWTVYVPQVLSQTYKTVRAEAKAAGLNPTGPSDFFQKAMRDELMRLGDALYRIEQGKAEREESR